MFVFNEISENTTLKAALFAWFFAQALKVVIVLIREKKWDFTRLIGAGGMPSSHTALVTAAAMSVGFNEGFYSAVFALSSVFALVVMYDAAGVRRAAGEQARTLNLMLDNWNRTNVEDEYDIEATLKELLGHTPVEVLMGGVLGVAVAVLMNY